jgi:LysM repeat protein
MTLLTNLLQNSTWSGFSLQQGWYNAGMKLSRSSLILGLVVMLILAACSSAPQATNLTPGVTLEGTLRPYPSDTATQTPLPTGYVTPTPSPTITPTWTPVYYNVRENDDMFGISLWYGISLEALKTANPTVNPYAIGIGTVLLIPLTPQAESTPRPTPNFTPTPTPLFSAINQPDCHPDGNQGLTCFVLVENANSSDLENVGGIVTLTDLVSGEIRQEVAIMPLNLLHSGTSMPMVVYFSAPVPEKYSVSAVVDIILPVMQGDSRYVNLVNENQQVDYASNNLSATISGQLTPEGKISIRSARLLAIAYDLEGHVLGIRVWESPSPADLVPGEQQDFSLTVYSMGGEIDHIDILTEAKAVTP